LSVFTLPSSLRFARGVIGLSLVEVVNLDTSSWRCPLRVL
jgi:hypothetical protein